MPTSYDYDYFSDVKDIYNAKVGWNNSTTDEERKKHSDIANAARERLKAYGYEDIANQLTADGADATVARQVMEKYAPKVVSDTNSNTNTNTNIKSPIETNKLKSKEVNRENAGLFDKYNKEYDDLKKTNPFTTEEAKAILGKYSLAGLQGRDNEVAKVGASNGGNIDSYGAANAMRQQASLLNQGQMVVLDAHQQKIDNIRGLLSDMGVNIDRVFNQDETAKNNEVARLSEQASVTGYVPKQWQYSNNPYFNSDGTLNEVYTSTDFDSTGGFTTIINNAKAKLATTTDATERANLEATIKYATQAKAYKTLHNPQYAKYAHEVEGVTPDRTADYDATLKQLDSAEKVALGEAEASVLSSQAEAEAEYNKAYLDYSAKVYAADKEAEVNYAKLQAEADKGNYDAGYMDAFVDGWDETNTGPRNFSINILWGEYVNNGITPQGADLIELIKKHTKDYNLDVADAKRICEFFRTDTKWLENYEDCTDDDDYSYIKNDGTTVNVKGKYLGMRLKNQHYDENGNLVDN